MNTVRRGDRRWVLVGGVSLLLLGLCVLLGVLTLGAVDGDLERADQLAGVIGGIVATALTVVGIAVTAVFGYLQLRASTPEPHEKPAPAEPLAAQPDPAPLAADIDRLRLTVGVVYERLFGITDMVTELGESLVNPAGARIISIWGGAGVGKTTLAYEVVRVHAEAAGFARVFSVSAKSHHIGPSGALVHKEIQRRWQDLLVELARQVDGSTKPDPGSIDRVLPDLFPEAPCLVVLDNLETVPEARLAVTYLASRFADGPHRFLLTTRESVARMVAGHVNERPWHGLSTMDAKRYAEYLARSSTALDPSDADLDDVVAAAERTPLLIQIIVRYAAEKALPIGDVIRHLRDVGGPLGRNLWRYCYRDSMRALAESVGSQDVAARLMAAFCYPGLSITDEEFYRRSRIEDRELFLTARATACRLTLVRQLEGNTRFTVHPLLREHFCLLARR